MFRMVKNKDIGFFRKIFLMFLTSLQEMLIRNDEDLDMYFRVTKLHFKVFFRKNLLEEAMNNSREFRAAQKRHVAMYHHNCRPIGGKNHELLVSRTFRDNVLLEVAL